MRYYAVSARLMLCQNLSSEASLMYLPDKPPNYDNLRIRIPSIIEEEWKSTEEVLEGIITHKKVRNYLRKKLLQMDATQLSPAYIAHPLLRYYITLTREDSDQEFVERLKAYKTIAQVPANRHLNKVSNGQLRKTSDSAHLPPASHF